MRMLSLFPSRFSSTGLKRSVRNRRGTLRSRRRGLGAWERLGLGMEGLEQLEQRSLMAADLVVTLNDNIAANVDRTFYSPGSQVVYTLTVENKGDATATDALIKTSLASAIKGATWTAAYTGGGTGLSGGAGNLGEHAKIVGQDNSKAFSTTVTLPSGATATFTIVGTIPGDATGKLTSTASVTLDSETKTATD